MIFIITSKATWFLLRSFTWREVIAVATAANTARIIMKKYLNQKDLPSLNNGKKTAEKADKPASFFLTVYKIARQVPRGRVTSYGAIAEASGLKITGRMVGWAMAAAGGAKPAVPAHRVVNSKGELSGAAHFATPTLMQELLEQEGIEVKNNKIINFQSVFWNPATPGPKKRVTKQ
ncbi:6-O-methylguanine DNA methyltransferase, DNA binding domain [Chitinophaga terrae (ex Kim and Jung 2007)]|uniref:6-O-methylguanine DNA methyltransferase, DNA binding domain n=2 Tax=Chitinophaga terrae (ex Kim and Jung 2007) TaxID=408074 RepID=A0A1H3XT51_9BACT|nr:6-O-methylguanine DNA methyltransferase, DNA binding domain [Chitinophaga terrae (ex Kim and Jung 2007)]